MTSKHYYFFALVFSLAICFNSVLSAQVGIGTTTPADGAMLDIESTDKGVLVPRVDIADLGTIAPITPAATAGLLVWNTNATTGVGFHYWDGTQWVAIAAAGVAWNLEGNNLTAAEGGTTTTDGTSFIGTTNDHNLNFRTNNILRGRLSNLGEFFIGTQNTIIPGDLMNAVGNNTFPWAVNGYTDFDGSGVYGLVQSGNTVFAGVQGEYEGTNVTGPGVRGITSTSAGGFDFFGNTVSGVSGLLLTGNAPRAFGVMGQTGSNLGTRVGGVLGTNYFASGALGYFSNLGNDFGVYAFGSGIAAGNPGGRGVQASDLNTHIGMGIHGGFMGGWVKGQEYGAIFSGNRFGSYTQGKSISNEAFVVLDKKSTGEKQVTYASTSLSIDVQSKGVGQLSSGLARINFDKGFSDIIDGTKPIIVTITPYGESNGVHIVSVDKHG
jgi:hypothetical protein